MQEKILSDKKNGMLVLIMGILLYRIDSAYNIRRGIRNDATYDNRHTLDELRLDTFRRP